MWKYRKLIPIKFQKASGISEYQFRVLNPWHRPYRFVATGPRTAAHIHPSAFCSLRLDAGVKHILVSADRFPALAEAVLLMGKCLFAGNRVEKYMTAYKAYECLAPAPHIELSAVRHGLSHASSALSRPSTVRALEDIFGTTQIDLDRYPHQKQFYIQLGYLLQAVDEILFARLCSALPDLTILASEHDPLQDWQITGAWGERPHYELLPGGKGPAA